MKCLSLIFTRVNRKKKKRSIEIFISSHFKISSMILFSFFFFIFFFLIKIGVFLLSRRCKSNRKANSMIILWYVVEEICFRGHYFFIFQDFIDNTFLSFYFFFSLLTNVSIFLLSRSYGSYKKTNPMIILWNGFCHRWNLPLMLLHHV